MFKLDLGEVADWVFPEVNSKKYKDTIKFIVEADPRDRVAFFSPEALEVYPEEERAKQWVYRFLLFSKYYFLSEMKYKRAKFHYKYLTWFYETVISREKVFSKVYDITTSREFLKTLDAKHLIIYSAAYRLNNYVQYLSNSRDKLRDEFADIYNKCKTPSFLEDYGELVLMSSSQRIKFLGSSVSETKPMLLQGVTPGTVNRGITHNGFKCEFAIVDDIETTETIRSIRTTESNYRIYQADFFASMLGSSRRIIHLNNYISSTANVDKFIKEADEYMIIGLYVDENTKELTWPERYVELKEELDFKGNENKEAVEELRNAFLKQHRGLDRFREEHLCSPDSRERLYHDIDKIRAIELPLRKRPLNNKEIEAGERFCNTYVDETIEYNIMKTYDPTKTYVWGVDLSSGVGLDSQAGVLIEVGKRVSTIVATVENNRVNQLEFCNSNLRFFKQYGVDPFVVIESNYGDSYRDTLMDKQYPQELIYKEEKKDKGYLVPEKRIGYHLSKVSRETVSVDFKAALESGDLINLSEALDFELDKYTKEHHVENNKRVDNLEGLVSMSNHFDLLSAGRIAWAGVSSSIRNKYEGQSQSIHEDFGFLNRNPTSEEKYRY